MQLATRFRAVIALKGAGTVIADPAGPWWINNSGNPGLASAGMGDVLSGIVGALLAQGVPARDALVAGVHLHGLAADRCLARNGGPVGMTASEVTLAAREVLNAAVYGPPAANPG
jgi:NAD(P)H-hydrate repair Nnr-like enzyme with NAD(P)H-hydrate dehydratase domain